MLGSLVLLCQKKKKHFFMLQTEGLIEVLCEY